MEKLSLTPLRQSSGTASLCGQGFWSQQPCVCVTPGFPSGVSSFGYIGVFQSAYFLHLDPVCVSDSTGALLEQKPRWSLVLRGQAVTLRCILRDSLYPWMGWYQQDLQQQLQSLVSLRSSGDKEVKSVPGADYLATRVTDTELRLRVANVTQGRTLFCTCSTDTVVHSAGELEQKPHRQTALPPNPCSSASPSETSSFLARPPQSRCPRTRWALPDLPLVLFLPEPHRELNLRFWRSSEHRLGRRLFHLSHFRF